MRSLGMTSASYWLLVVVVAIIGTSAGARAETTSDVMRPTTEAERQRLRV